LLHINAYLHSQEASSKEYLMNLNINSAALALDPGQLVTLEDACGTQIRMQDGSAWITEEGEQSDYTLSPGEAHTVMHHGRTLVQAMNAAHITLREQDVPCAANDSSGPVEAMHAAIDPPWYASGLRAVSTFLDRAAKDFEDQAIASRVHVINDSAGEQPLARYRLDAQLGYMNSDPRYF
jgi:hypothetical protein